MAESMTVVEIEDVLSSIRRLVSDDLRPTNKLVSAAMQNAASKLILTPALRIVSEVRTALPEHETEDDSSEALQTVLLDIEEEEELTASRPTPIFGSIRAQDRGDAPRSPESDVLPDASFLTSAISRINGISDLDASAAQPESIEAVVAAVGAAVGPDEWELDGGEPAPQSAAWADTVWSNDIVETSSTAEAAQEIAAPETADLRSAPDVLPETATENLLTLPVLTLDRKFGESDRSAPLHDDEDQTHSSDSESLGFDDAASFINEDVLREIVRDMIREELQGTLGERITRNVRKLVRAEISRALASRDFDAVAHRG